MIFLHRSNIVVSTGIAAGNLDVGAEVILNENGQPVNYLIVNQGIPENSPLYDASCDGTWLLRKDIRENGQWDSSKYSNDLVSALIMTTMAGYVSGYDSAIQEAIKTVKIPYMGDSNSGGAMHTGADGLECKVFPIGGYELGLTESDNQDLPQDGAKLSYFDTGTGAAAKTKRIAYLNGAANNWWLKSRYRYTDIQPPEIMCVWSNGNITYNVGTSSYGLRPTLILPYDFKFTDAEVVA